jgi:hypothetical protein
MVRLQATELDVYVNHVNVGWVTDCGDCWRVSRRGRAKRRRFPDYETREQAVAGLVASVK